MAHGQHPAQCNLSVGCAVCILYLRNSHIWWVGMSVELALGWLRIPLPDALGPHTQGGAPPPPEGAEGVQEDFILNVELTLHNASSLAPQLLVNGTLINGAHQWSDCVYNSTHRR
jgi:hypothetical protein